MKKKQGYALGSLLLGAASWLCLLGLRRIEKRMKRNRKNKKNHTAGCPAVWFFFVSLWARSERLSLMLFGSYVANGCGRRSWQ